MRNAVRAGRDGNNVRTIACRCVVRLLFSFFLSLVFSFLPCNRISKDCLNLSGVSADFKALVTSGFINTCDNAAKA